MPTFVVLFLDVFREVSGTLSIYFSVSSQHVIMYLPCVILPSVSGEREKRVSFTSTFLTSRNIQGNNVGYA